MWLGCVCRRAGRPLTGGLGEDHQQEHLQQAVRRCRHSQDALRWKPAGRSGCLPGQWLRNPGDNQETGSFLTPISVFCLNVSSRGTPGARWCVWSEAGGGSWPGS